MFFCSFSGAILVPCLGTSPANWVFVFVLCQKKCFCFYWEWMMFWPFGALGCFLFSFLFDSGFAFLWLTNLVCAYLIWVSVISSLF